MKFTRLRENYDELLCYLEKEGYNKSYIRCIKFDIRWVLKNENNKSWQSYIDIYQDRVSKSKSEQHKRNKRLSFGVIQQFDIYGEYPSRRIKNSLIKRGAYYQLNAEYKELIDFYKQADKARGLKDNTINRTSSNTASFLYAMQNKGLKNLGSISEEDVLSFFLDDKGVLSKSSSYKKQIAAVFKAGINWNEKECRKIVAYLPRIRPKRKNIQFLTPKEVERIRDLLNDETSALSLRNRAIGKLLFFTGIRPCDIAAMEQSSIDWEAEEINLPQQKTGVALNLPLTATIGNSIYDYIVNERPKSSDPHLFLGELYPHYPFTASALWKISATIYKAAGLRQNKNDRCGTHLFRYNVATSFLSSGISRPVISETLGQLDPLSLDAYLHADFTHLKECALSIEAFPISEEVFSL